MAFIGPYPDTIDLFGDKTAARRFAIECSVPVLMGSAQALPDPAAVRVDMAAQGIAFPIMLKAAGGGGGRGIREVHTDAELDETFARCASEAQSGFGSAAVFYEELLIAPRHIEVQVLGDGKGDCIHLFERDCSVQLRRQKVVEMTPVRSVPAGLLSELRQHALTLTKKSKYRSAGTVEFLVSGSKYAFIEANPRIQVEHTVTEEATGVDLVQTQLLLATGRSLVSLGLQQSKISVQHCAIQARVVMSEVGTIAGVCVSPPIWPT